MNNIYRIHPQQAGGGQLDKNMTVRNHQSRLFRFDKVLNKTVSQAEVFEESYIPFMIKQVIEGFHSTIFAYGQTGSGKTYTMEGYKYMQNEKGIYLPRINEESPDNYGLV